MRHYLFLKIKKDEPMLMLKNSLIFDGRFYGAESQQESDEFSQYLGWVYFTKHNWFKSLIESEQSQQSLN